MLNGKYAQNSANPLCTFASQLETCSFNLTIQGMNEAVKGFFVF